MYKQNYKSDFKFTMKRYTYDAKVEQLTPVPWPEDVDWRVLLKTPHSAKAYEASCRGGVLSNCEKTDDGGILIAMDKHGLSTGELRYEFHFELPDPVMASGIADLYKPGSTGIMLTTDASCECGGLVNVAVVTPMYKGDKGEPFRYSDFTPEQLEDLRRPAQEAADEATEAVSALEKAVSDAEDLRVKAEDARDRAEQERNRTEGERKANETARQTAESEREKALSDIIAQAQSALKAANEAIAAADKATQLANDAAELCATKIAQFEAIGKEILSHQYLTLEN